MGVERGFAPSQGQGTASLVGFGATPQQFHGRPASKRTQQRRRQRSVPASNFARPQTRPPSCSFQRLCCVAQMARPNCLSFRHGCLFPQAGISRLRARPKGNENRRSLRSPFGNLRHRNFWGYLLLVSICCRDFAPAGASRGLCDCPPTPLRSAHPCGLTFIATLVCASADAIMPCRNGFADV